MSAFLVSKAHIDLLVQARYLDGIVHVRPMSWADDDTLGQILLRENMLSLVARYGDPVDSETIKAHRFAMPKQKPSVIELIKLFQCYTYQACEHEGWEKSLAHGYCRDMTTALITLLPGYTEAAWGVN